MPSSKNSMHRDLVRALRDVRARRAFDPHAWLAKKSEILNSYMSKSGLKGCVVSVSGGVDSAVIFAIISHAMKQPGSPIVKLLGVAQPIHSTASIQNRAYELSPFGTIITVDQTPVFDMLKEISDKAIGIHGEFFAAGNLRSYMRTPVGFYAAQLLSQSGYPALVVGTGNKDEDGFLYYFSKAGDGIADIQLIADLHKSEVFAVGRYLDVPPSILGAAPSADLWDGATDEEEIGAPYDFVELYTTYREDDARREALLGSVCDEARLQYLELGEKIECIHRRNKHKAHFPLNL